MRLSVVIPTILGPKSNLPRLLRSIEQQAIEPKEVVLVVQRVTDQQFESLSFNTKLNLRIIRSDPGLSKARNNGFAALVESVDFIAIPDDDIWYHPDAFAELSKHAMVGHGCVVGTLKTDGASNRMRSARDKTSLTKRNCWQLAIEAASFIEPRAWDLVSGFDEGLGLGADSPWQSGEGTDLLLRLLAAGYAPARVPEIELYEDAPESLSRTELAQRKRNYARGTGRVYKRNYTLTASLGFAGRSLVACLTSMPRDGRKVSTWLLLGRLEGLTGRVLPKNW